MALGELVYTSLQTHLRSGAIAAGQALQEVQIAESLGVSRTPVREAMHRLASEGLLKSEGRSFMVPELSLADVDYIYEVRFLIEPAALRGIAAAAADPAVRAPVDAALADAVAAHKADDAAAFREAAARFRAAWLALVPNPRLVRVIEQYADHMQHIRALTIGDTKVRAIVLKGLKQVATALAKGDGEAAAAAMHENLRQARKAFIATAGLRPRAPESAQSRAA
jgi:DNA-binding GntR family transcriptional regulator